MIHIERTRIIIKPSNRPVLQLVAIFLRPKLGGDARPKAGATFAGGHSIYGRTVQRLTALERHAFRDDSRYIRIGRRTELEHWTMRRAGPNAALDGYSPTSSRLTPFVKHRTDAQGCRPHFQR